MIKLKEKLLKTLNDFYPKNIHGLDDNYNKKEQILKLFDVSEKAIKKNYDNWLTLNSEINSCFTEEKLVVDKTTFFISQPSFVFQISEYNNDTAYNFYYSFIIPYFYISKVIKTGTTIQEIEKNPNEVLGIKRNKLEQLFKSQFNIELFPEKLLDIIVPDISFEAIPFGEFTFKNAFFNKTNTII